MDPKWTQNGPKMDPKWTQNGPKMDPKWTHTVTHIKTHLDLDTHMSEDHPHLRTLLFTSTDVRNVRCCSGLDVTIISFGNLCQKVIKVCHFLHIRLHVSVIGERGFCLVCCSEMVRRSRYFLSQSSFHGSSGSSRRLVLDIGPLKHRC